MEDATMSAAQRGQVLVFFALVLPLVLLPVVAYAVDAAVSASTMARLQEATTRAAEEAAQQVDASRFRSGGGIAVDVAAAVAVAVEDIQTSEPGASVAGVTVSGTTVYVRTREKVMLPLQFVGAPEVTISAFAVARLAVGYERPSSRLPLVVSTF
jgi:hypothetical protein